VNATRDGRNAVKIGETLVAKETLYEEQLRDSVFHINMCKVQAEAQELAMRFNRRVSQTFGGGGAQGEWQVNFADTWIYEVLDDFYEQGRGWILAEPELEGKFTKWNNNAGGLRAPLSRRGGGGGGGLGIGGAIIEEDEEEDEDEDGGSAAIVTDDVPQCFSHFTWSVTDGKRLVCDLQGVWNHVDGFVLTDPALHYHRGRHKHGGTDKGQDGIDNFFKTHTCSPMCVHLGLKQF